MYLISILYAREKKVKIFFYIERYGNDLHRPTSFSFFHRLEEKKISRTKNENFSRLQSFYEIGNLQSTIDKKDRQYSEMLAVIVIFVCFYLSN